MNPGVRFAMVCLAGVLAFAGGACGDGVEFSPTAPSSISGLSAPAGGATITGRVNGGSGLAHTTSGSAGSITVTVSGTNITATVDGVGQFTLTGVPEGTIQLQFKGPGINATVTITVTGEDQIQIAVTVNGNSAHVESEHRVGRDKKAEIKGRITEIDPAARTLHVSGTLVNVPMDAKIRRGSHILEFIDLKIGDKVEVRGVFTGTALQASEIKVEGERKGGLYEVEGKVWELDGTCPALTFMVKDKHILTDGATYFKRSTCLDLHDDAKVEVKGIRQADGSILAVEVRIEQQEFEVKGMASALTGMCPTITFEVERMEGDEEEEPIVVTTTTSTRYKNGECADVLNGVRVEVEGVRRATGMIAEKIDFDDDKEDDDEQ